MTSTLTLKDLETCKQMLDAGQVELMARKQCECAECSAYWQQYNLMESQIKESI